MISSSPDFEPGASIQCAFVCNQMQHQPEVDFLCEEPALRASFIHVIPEVEGYNPLVVSDFHTQLAANPEDWRMVPRSSYRSFG